MADDPPDFSNRGVAQRWLAGQPREVSEVIAVRAALRVFPVLVLVEGDLRDRLGTALLLPVLHAAASPWLANGLVSQGEAEQARKAAARAARAAYAAAAAAAADAEAAAAAVAAAAAAADAAAAAVAFAAAYAAAAAADAAADAAAFVSGLDRRQVLALPLWPDENDRNQPDVPARIVDRWKKLRLHLEGREDEGWQVWIDWYEARLRGDPIEWDLQRAFLQPPKTWEADPKTLNAAIAARLADLLSSRTPSPRPVGVDPTSGDIEASQPPVNAEPSLPEPASLIERLRSSLPRRHRRLPDPTDQDPFALLRPILGDVEDVLGWPHCDPVDLHAELEGARDEVRRLLNLGEISNDSFVVRIAEDYDRASNDIEGLYPTVAAAVRARQQARLRDLKDAEVRAMRSYLDAVEAVLGKELRRVIGEDVGAQTVGAVAVDAGGQF
ncbi:MAG: hypothetical protein AAFU61_08795, partial [Pseudomonadota bacterium]